MKGIIKIRFYTTSFKGKGSCLRVQTPWQRMFNRLYLSPGIAGKVSANAACNYWSSLGCVCQVPIMAGWTKAVWNTKFAWHFYTWSALESNPRPSDLESNTLSTGPHALNVWVCLFRWVRRNPYELWTLLIYIKRLRLAKNTENLKVEWGEGVPM